MAFSIPVYDFRGDKVIARVELPDGELWVCGTDFCDKCGDCLACYGSDACCSGTEADEHDYVVYQDELELFLSRHPSGVVVENDNSDD